MPEPQNVDVKDITPSAAVVTYTIPSSQVTVKEVELEINETESGTVRRIVRPALENGSVAIDDLKSGNVYTVRMRALASDGRQSDLTSARAFTTSKFESL